MDERTNQTMDSEGEGGWVSNPPFHSFAPFLLLSTSSSPPLPRALASCPEELAQPLGIVPWTLACSGLRLQIIIAFAPPEREFWRK